MEGLIALAVIGWIGYVVIKGIASFASGISSGMKNGNSGSSSGSWTESDQYFGPIEIKVEHEHDEEFSLDKKNVMIRGLIPVERPMDLSFKISVFDVTDDPETPEFIISYLEQIQEDESICFQASGNIGHVTVGDTWTGWVQLGTVIPAFLQTPKSGSRDIRVVVRLFNSNNPPPIKYGFGSGGEIVYLGTGDFSYEFTEKGYKEETADREEAQCLSLKIGVAVAMSDGSLDDSEGEILKNWIVREVSPYSDDKQKRLKKMFNDALKEGFAQAQSGNLSLSPLVERLSEIGEKKTKYDAIELCFDVMAADGVADPEEMAVIRKVADALDLDMDEIEKMREGVTLNLSTALTSEEGLESLVGIEESWTDDQKKKHLRAEFQKWSNRLNSLPEGDERESAQNMLDNIATLRKKYG